MSDPLGLIGRVGQAHGAPASTSAGPGAQGGPSFREVLMNNINEVNKLQGEANSAMEDLVAGRRDDVEGVFAAAQKADTAFRALLSVRNKVTQAYEEIKQMRV